MLLVERHADKFLGTDTILSVKSVTGSRQYNFVEKSLDWMEGEKSELFGALSPGCVVTIGKS